MGGQCCLTAQVEGVVETSEAPAVKTKNFSRLTVHSEASIESLPEAEAGSIRRSHTPETSNGMILVHDGDTLRMEGLEKAFDRKQLGERRACAISSLTDKLGSKKGSFAEKDLEFRGPADRQNDHDSLLEWMREDVGIGWSCRKGKKPFPTPNQDSFSVVAVESEYILVGVFDGHGVAGHDVSQFTHKEMFKLFLQHPEYSSNTEQALTDTFLEAQRRVTKVSGCQERETQEQSNAEGSEFDAWESGTTATMAFLDIPKCTLTFAHVADSRSALGTTVGLAAGMPYEAQDMTVDHKPDLPAEKERIESSNPPGMVIFDGYVNYRVLAKGKDYPGLNMSRAIGDVCAHKLAGLTATPDTRTVDLKPLLKDNAKASLLVCSDGVWEFMTTEQAFECLPTQGDQNPNKMVNKLCGESWAAWLQATDNEVSDDITAVCLQLHRACSQQTA